MTVRTMFWPAPESPARPHVGDLEDYDLDQARAAIMELTSALDRLEARLEVLEGGTEDGPTPARTPARRPSARYGG